MRWCWPCRLMASHTPAMLRPLPRQASRGPVSDSLLVLQLLGMSRFPPTDACLEPLSPNPRNLRHLVSQGQHPAFHTALPPSHPCPGPSNLRKKHPRLHKGTGLPPGDSHAAEGWCIPDTSTLQQRPKPCHSATPQTPSMASWGLLAESFLDPCTQQHQDMWRGESLYVLPALRWPTMARRVEKQPWRLTCPSQPAVPWAPLVALALLHGPESPGAPASDRATTWPSTVGHHPQLCPANWQLISASPDTPRAQEPLSILTSRRPPAYAGLGKLVF